MGLLSTVLGIFSPRLGMFFDPPRPAKEETPLRFGILGASAIAPSALIQPALSTPGVVIQAVAARDEQRAQRFAQKHGIPVVFKSYQEMLDSPDIDAIYNPLPNGLHFEWTIKALKAGKHVLLEKPSSSRSEETRQMFELAKQKNLVLLEAFHYRFHPANQRFREIATNGSLGELRNIEVRMSIHEMFLSRDDIRFNYDLGGGATTDMGTYTISYSRWLAGSEPTVEFAKAELVPGKPQIDRAMEANLLFTSPNGQQILSNIFCDLARPWKWGILPHLPVVDAKAICANGEVEMEMFAFPVLKHSITISEKGKPKRVEYCFKPTDPKVAGEEWWSTYRYQLEAFVDKVRGREPAFWISGEDSVAQMKVLEAVYAKAGLEQRPASSYKP